jgi:hypothetical protein
MSSIGQIDNHVSFIVLNDNGEGQENIPIVAVKDNGSIAGRGLSDSNGMGVIRLKTGTTGTLSLIGGTVAGCKLSITPERQEAEAGSQKIHEFVVSKKALVRSELLFVGAAAFIAGVLVREFQELSK